MSFFKKIFSKKEDKNEGKPIPRSNLDKTKVVDKEQGLSTEKRKPAWIDKIDAPAQIKEKEILKLSISGNFSDLGWQFAEVQMTMEKNEIIINVIGKRKAGTLAGQTLKPFQVSFEIANLKRGKYAIKAGKGKTSVINVEVI